MHAHQPGKHSCCHGSHGHVAPTPRIVVPPLRGDATAAAVCERMKLQLSLAARRQLTAHVSSEHFFARLLTAELDADARKFLAAALPVRRALWWSVLAIHDALGADEQQERDRLAPVVQWIARPSDAGLIAVRRLDLQVKRNSMWGCLYQATYAAGGRVSPPERQMVAAPPETSRRFAAALVYMASVYRGARGYRERQRRYLLLGQSLATGPAPWSRRMHSMQETT
ncbi:hypothetical protein LOC68_15885 [Blastopirellula sp. JC732]|uniref:Uncharacterized protein n=1 Tax=Blastopirellula sediminis TaxID=2894196 RepID=A0A9X1MN71_9BACT|nr:hypothetical protein [Blastopirellula sediminis]MCC9606833.1 hypothetical protein [Blastopirellula sediminis]MCC9629871.1 hypothetical protein [Blastopirellula sediminis]